MNSSINKLFLLPALLVCLLALWTCAQRGTPVTAPPPPTLLDNPIAELPGRLSDIGLFEKMATETLSPRVIPYEIRYALFSDYNDKARYVFIPDGQQIDNRDPREWRFPVGTIFFKTFYLTTLGNANSPRKKIETRILQQRENGWHVATYQWNAESTEAYITDGTEIRIPFSLPRGNYTYTIPGKLACLACHQSQKNFVIGFEQIRLKTAVGGAPGDQLQILREKDLFAVPPDESFNNIEGPPFEQDAIGYLHGNCANCHNPTSPVYSTTALDLRYWQLKSNTINILPVKFTNGDSTQFRVKPGSPETSILYQLMARTITDSTQFMPPLGTTMIDTNGLALVRDWILSLP